MHFVFLALGYHPDLVGGAYRYAAELGVRLAANGHGVDVIMPNPENRLPARETRDGVGLHRYRDEKGGGWRSWKKENGAAMDLMRALCCSKTLVGCHQAFFEPCLSPWAQRSVALFHGPWGLEYLFARRSAPRNPLRKWIDRILARRLAQVEGRALRRVRRIFVMSQYVASRLPEWHGSLSTPVEVIYGGVDTVRFAPPRDREVLRKGLGLEEGEFLFATVRRLDPRMGLLTLVEGFAAIAKAFPCALLWIAGTGSQQAEIQARVRRLGLEGRVKLAGFVPEEDLPGFLGAADCTLMPSLDLEGFGLATVESLACGTPVLGSKAGATPEVLASFGGHLLFDAGSADALAASLRTALTQPGFLPSRERCRDHVLREFTWNRPVAAMERAWDQLVG